MRCKRHTVDSTSTIGVCSSCLRERLLSLAASAAIEDHNNNNNHQSKKSNPPPLLIFPRSVSPYVTRRKSDVTTTTTNRNRFITTPQVDLVGISCKDFESSRHQQQQQGKKVSRFAKIFRTRSQDLESSSDPRFSCDVSESSSTSSRSWFTTILSGGRSKKEPTTTINDCYIEDVISNRRPQRVFCRGMSPARDSEETTTESVDETPGRLRNTPATTTARTPGRKKSGNGLAGMGFCLSPLVRASPNCPFKKKLRFPHSEFGNSGEVTVVQEKPHISAAASFCANRSKKLVDLGRVDRRR